MDISEILQKKSKDLLIIAKQLEIMCLSWENPIQLYCSDLTENSHPSLNALDNYNDTGKQAVYYFKINNNNLSSNDIVNALDNYKSLKKRSCPKIHRIQENDSNYLYCGSVTRIALNSRFIQHLGFGPKDTYSLQLVHWAKGLKLELKFYYSFIPQDSVRLTEYIESCLSEKLNPLVGKKPQL